MVITNMGVNTLQTWGVLHFLHFFDPSLFPLCFPPPLIQLGVLGERCKFPQRVLAEPGHRTHFSAFRGKKLSVSGDKFRIF